jgi:hypothetical protein
MPALRVSRRTALSNTTPATWPYFEGLSAQQRASLRIDLGFMPEPVPLSIAVGMRLNEVSQHAWDVQVAVDPNAEVDEASATSMVEHLAGGLSLLLGFIAKPDRLDEPARVAIGKHTLIVDDAVSIRPSAEGATATFEGTSRGGTAARRWRAEPPSTPPLASTSPAASRSTTFVRCSRATEPVRGSPPAPVGDALRSSSFTFYGRVAC